LPDVVDPVRKQLQQHWAAGHNGTLITLIELLFLYEEDHIKRMQKSVTRCLGHSIYSCCRAAAPGAWDIVFTLVAVQQQVRSYSYS
jgi:hypothetical protein